MKKTDKPKEITNEDLQAAILAEARELLSEKRELITKRAYKRLKEKFGR